jgi:predicted metal-binding protein
MFSDIDLPATAVETVGSPRPRMFPGTDMADRPRLHICVTCRAGRDLAEGETAPGQHLHDAVASLIDAAPDASPVVLDGVKCLAACERGCVAAISMPGKWTYILGHLDVSLAEDLLIYGRVYAASNSGAVLPSRRPPSLQRVVVGRFPALPAEVLA